MNDDDAVVNATAVADTSFKDENVTQQQQQEQEELDVANTATRKNISLLDITSGENDRGIPFCKFIDDVGVLAASFTPPASAEVLIGAFTELYSKFKSFETSLIRKGKYYIRSIRDECDLLYRLAHHHSLFPLIIVHTITTSTRYRTKL
jgi:hypothetical protein